MADKDFDVQDLLVEKRGFLYRIQREVQDRCPVWLETSPGRKSQQNTIF